MSDRMGLKAGVVAVALGVLFAGGPAGTAIGDNRQRVMNVSPGVTYRLVKEPGPNRVHVLTIDPTRDATIDVGLAKPNLPGYARPSSIAQARGAVAAINGDFGISPGRPGHLYAEDGELIQTTLLGADGKNFAVSLDEDAAYVANPDVSITLFQVASRRTWSIAKWNVGTPAGQAVAGYSVSAGSTAPTPRNSCSARLTPASGYTWAPSKAGVTRGFTVDQVLCGPSSMPLNGGIVLASQTTGGGADNIRGLARGETVRLTWSSGFPGTVETIGGSPILLQNGRVMVSACNTYLCQKHPRTAVGVTGTGKILLVVVDGRWSGVSVGMTLVQLANEMKKLGAVDAMNLDGGGSSAMWIRGKGIMNNPSDGDERSVPNAVLVMPNRDPGDPNMAGPDVSREVADLQAAFDPAGQTEAEQAAYGDPASTGGLLEYLGAEEGGSD